MKKKAFCAAFPVTLPVLTGYLFLGVAYGLLMQKAGLSVWVTLAMSALVYAGSMQYAAIPLLCGAFAPLSALSLALMVNARHVFYGVSLLPRYRKTGGYEPYLAFSLTDETFSVNVSANLPPDLAPGDFYFAVSVLDQSYWVAASVMGHLFGSALTLNTEGVEFVMTALFAVIATGQWMETREHRPALIGLGASAVCLALFGSERFILPAMGLILLLLLALHSPLERALAAGEASADESGLQTDREVRR